MQTFSQWLVENAYALNKHAHWGIVVPSGGKEGHKVIRGDKHPTATTHDDLAKEHFKKKTDDMLKQHPGTVRYVSQNSNGKRELNFELSTHPKSTAMARKLISHPKHNSPEGAFGGHPSHYYAEFKDKHRHDFETPEWEDDAQKHADNQFRRASQQD